MTASASPSLARNEALTSLASKVRTARSASRASAFREKIYAILMDDKADEQLESLFQACNARDVRS